MTESKKLEKKDLNINCIICPSGCELTISSSGGEIAVSGNKCKRGNDYGTQEFLHPHRTVTSSVRLTSGGVLPVKTSVPVPKDKIFAVLDEIKKCETKHPVKMGEVIIKNVCDTEADIVATKSTKSL